MWKGKSMFLEHLSIRFDKQKKRSFVELYSSFLTFWTWCGCLVQSWWNQTGVGSWGTATCCQRNSTSAGSRFPIWTLLFSVHPFWDHQTLSLRNERSRSAGTPWLLIDCLTERGSFSCSGCKFQKEAKIHVAVMCENARQRQMRCPFTWYSSTWHAIGWRLQRSQSRTTIHFAWCWLAEMKKHDSSADRFCCKHQCGWMYIWCMNYYKRKVISIFRAVSSICGFRVQCAVLKSWETFKCSRNIK